MMPSKKERFFMELDEAVKAELKLAEEFLISARCGVRLKDNLCFFFYYISFLIPKKKRSSSYV